MFAFETIKNVLKQNIQINYVKYVPMYDNHERIKNREWCTLNELQISCTHLSKTKKQHYRRNWWCSFKPYPNFAHW